MAVDKNTIVTVLHCDDNMFFISSTSRSVAAVNILTGGIAVVGICKLDLQRI